MGKVNMISGGLDCKMGWFKSKCLRWKHPSKRNVWLGNGICRDKDGGVETRI